MKSQWIALTIRPIRAIAWLGAFYFNFYNVTTWVLSGWLVFGLFCVSTEYVFNRLENGIFVLPGQPNIVRASLVSNLINATITGYMIHIYWYPQAALFAFNMICQFAFISIRKAHVEVN